MDSNVDPMLFQGKHRRDTCGFCIGADAYGSVSVCDLVAADNANSRALADARLAAQRCGIREGETLAEFIRRLHDEANEDRDDED